MIVMKTGDKRVVFVSKGSHYQMVMQDFSETKRHGYKSEIPYVVDRYWLTHMPKEVDFEDPVVVSASDIFDRLFNPEHSAVDVIGGDNSAKTKFLLPSSSSYRSSSKNPYFIMPALIDQKSSFYLKVGAAEHNDLKAAKSYAINQLEQNHLWALIGSEIYIKTGSNMVHYLLDAKITGFLKGKKITDHALEKILIKSIEHCK